MNAIIESTNDWGARFAAFALPMLIQSAVFIALLFALDLALRTRVRATIRYAVWMLVLVKLALPPSLALPTGAAYWLPAKTVEPPSAPVLALAAPAAETSVDTTYLMGGAVQTLVPPAANWQAFFLMVWLTMGLGMGIWVVWRLRMVAGVIRQSSEAPDAVQALLESCRRQLGIKRAIRVRCAAIGSPAICGVLRPIILIPPVLAQNLGGAEMRPVLLHELAHYKRGDLWVNHAQIFLQIVYWYNPLLWLANACIRRAREQAVDEMVLVEMGGEAQTYPATLLHVAKLGLGRPMAAIGLMGILEPGRGLTQRILHIMNRPLPRTARIGARGLAAVLLLALVAIPMACRRKTESTLQSTVPTTNNTLLLTISKQGAMTLQNEAVTLDNWQAKLTEAYRENPQPTLAIWCSKKPDWEMTKKMIDCAIAAHVPVVNMVTMESPPSGELNDPTPPEPLVVAVRELKHTNLTNIFAGLQSTLSAGSLFMVDARTHKLFIRTTEREMPRVKMFIAKLDNDIDQTPLESAAPKTRPATDWSGKQLMHPGGMLAPTDVDELEAKLAEDPEDFYARRDLLAYYGFRDRAAKAKHVLWIIEHHPEFSGSGPEMSLNPAMEGSAYRQGKALWLQNVKSHPTNALILGNAAAYFTISDQATAEDLLKKAQVLEPQNPAWSERLGQLYKLEVMRQPGTNFAAKALAEFERAQTQTSPAVPGSPRLVSMADMAVAVGDLEKARTYATELLGPGLQWSGGGNAGDAFFHGNIALGRVALREGKLVEAKKYLLEAGNTSGSPVLDSFGPNMALAKELLEKGETNAVLEYFQESRRFWPRYGNDDKLGTWVAAVKSGKMPDFGANLAY